MQSAGDFTSLIHTGCHAACEELLNLSVAAFIATPTAAALLQVQDAF